MTEDYFFLLLQTFILLFFGGLSVDAKTQIPFGSQCFDQVDHRGISNGLPIAELWNLSPFDCLNHCILNAAKSGDGCASVVYHKHFSTCQLYNHDGNYQGAKIVFASGHDYFNRTSYTGECADRFTPEHGYPQGQNRPKVLAQNPTVPGEETKELESIDEKQISQPTKVEPTKKIENFLLANPPASKGCSRGQRSSYFAIKSFIPPFVESKAIIKGIDAEACLTYCTHNINAAGDMTPCTLIVYDTEQETCEIFDESVKELGIFTRLQNTTSTKLTAEKFCGLELNECSPDSGYIVHFGRKFSDGILGQMTRFDSATECLDVCLKNPQCKSFTFRSGRCLLHSIVPERDNKNDNTLEADSSSLVVGSKCLKL